MDCGEKSKQLGFEFEFEFVLYLLKLVLCEKKGDESIMINKIP